MYSFEFQFFFFFFNYGFNLVILTTFFGNELNLIDSLIILDKYVAIIVVFPFINFPRIEFISATLKP